MYSPILGRWLQNDMAGYVDGANLYPFAGCDPATAVDPSGTVVIFVHGIGESQHKDKGPLVYQGMAACWQEKEGEGIKKQAMVHFLYGPATADDVRKGSKSERVIQAAAKLKALVDTLRKAREGLKDCTEPIFIYAYS